MDISVSRFKKYVFVCENERIEGVCCGAAGSKIRERLKLAVRDRGLSTSVRVSRSGCLDVCSEGPNILIMPDNIWLKRVTEADVDEIIKRIEEGLRTCKSFGSE